MGPGHFQRVMSSIGVTLLVLCVRPSTCSQETMIRGCIRIHKRHSLVAVTAIESLAGVDVLCTDKTGTLTANQLSVHERTCYSHLEIRKVNNGWWSSLGGRRS